MEDNRISNEDLKDLIVVSTIIIMLMIIVSSIASISSALGECECEKTEQVSNE